MNNSILCLQPGGRVLFCFSSSTLLILFTLYNLSKVVFFEEEDPTDHELRILDIWKDYCESTYSLNLPVITEAEWIKTYLYDNYNRDAFLVRNGVRKDIYQKNGPTVSTRIEGKLRVLVAGPVDVSTKMFLNPLIFAVKQGLMRFGC